MPSTYSTSRVRQESDALSPAPRAAAGLRTGTATSAGSPSGHRAVDLPAPQLALRPALYYDPRPLLEERANLHAKCIVVDDRVALVTSANFTDRGQHRNIEVGMVIRDVAFARRLVGQFKNAMTGGHFRRWEPGVPGPSRTGNRE